LIIIPAVDIKGGRCVRLLQGRPEEETVFSNYPELMALKWQQEGAQRIHVVDLDGAFTGRPINRDTIKRIIESVNIPIQLGGGIRDIDTIEEYIKNGVERVILGTSVFENEGLLREACSKFPGRIAVSLDVMDGMIAVRGWRKLIDLTPIQIARTLEAFGVCSIIYTDISRDGTQKGINWEATAEFARSINIPVIASGGVGSIDDIKKALKYEGSGIEGVIIGKALYAGTISLQEAIRVVEKGDI
jgi:phosphoribosylformimino-5-aminoimidazole carboxamide ribotide isomerase